MQFHNDRKYPTELSANTKIVQSGQSVQSVIDSCSSPAADNPYVVMVPPVHEDETFTPKSHVQVVRYGHDYIATNKRLWSGPVTTDVIEQIHSCDNTTGAAVTSGTMVVDTAVKKEGSGSIKLTDIVTSGTSRVRFSGSWNIGKNRHLRLWLKMPINDAAAPSFNCQMWIYSGVSNFGLCALNSHFSTQWDDSWLHLNIPKKDFNVQGGTGIDWGNITDIYIRVTRTGGDANSAIYIDNLEIVNSWPFAAVVFRFDGSYDSHYVEGFERLHSRGYQGSLFCDLDILGDANMLTKDNIREMSDAGWDIGTHLITGLCVGGNYLTQKTRAEVKSIYCNATTGMRGIVGNAFKPYLAWPGGNVDGEALEIARGYFSLGMVASGGMDMLPRTESLMLRTTFCDGGTPVSTATSAIEGLVEHGGLLILAFHKIGAGENTTEAEFESILDAVEANGLTVVKLSEMEPIITGKPADTKEIAPTVYMLGVEPTSNSTTGTGEDDLSSITIAGNALSEDGGLKVQAGGTKTGAAGNKTIKLHWGSTSWTVHPAANNASDWRVEATIFNTAVAAQRISWICWSGTTLVGQGYETATENTEDNVVIKMTGECVDGADDITQTIFLCERF